MILKSFFTSLMISDAIQTNNKDANCGTVTDINKYATQFSVWSKKEFKK